MASAGEALAIGLGGGLASVFARCLVYPADVLRTVYVTKGKEGIAKLGIVDLYRGIYPAIVDAFAYHAANFGIYELLKGVYFRFTGVAGATVAAAQIGAPLPVAVRVPRSLPGPALPHHPCAASQRGSAHACPPPPRALSHVGSVPQVGLLLGMISGAFGMVACYPFTTVILRMSSEENICTI